MIFETKLQEEFHGNGQLAYTQNIAIISTGSEHLYENRRLHPEGYEWIRTGRQAKYFENGQLAWELEYDEKGNLIKKDYRQYREDGSIIQS